MTAAQSALTIVAEIASHETENLRSLLTEINRDVAGNHLVPFGRLTTTHYARFVIVDQAVHPSGRVAPATLLFMSDFDGSASRYLRHLADSFGPGIDRIYCHCLAYPDQRRISPAERLAYLRAHRVRSDATYVNTIGRTVEQIQMESQLRAAISDFLDRNGRDWAGHDALSVRAEIQRFVRVQEDLKWALEPAQPLGFFHRFSEALHLVILPAVALALSPVLILALPVWLVLLRVREQSDPAPHIVPDPEHVASLRSAEDLWPQNQFSAVGFFKAGRLRALTARGVLLLVNYGVRHIFNRGNLAGVKTIHFARWVPLNDRRRMIFVSNYDGSLESYMDDFIDKLAWGLNAVFSNGVGYPKTRWLIFGGAKDEQAFKDHLRVHQIRTDVWYAPYASLTVLNIENNARIRAGLSGDMTPSEARVWLSRL